MKSDIRYLIKNSGLTFALRIVGMGLGYGLAILISQLYGAGVYGRYSILVTFAQFSVMLFSLGLPVAIVKLTTEVEHFQLAPISNYLKKSFIILLLSGIIGSILIYSSSSLLGLNIFKDKELSIIFRYFSYFFVLIIIHNFSTQYFRGINKFMEYGLAMFIFPNILFFVFIFLFRGLNLTEEFYVFLSYILSLSIVGLVISFKLPLKVKTKRNYPYRSLLNLSLPILFSSAFLFISNWTDIFMLGSMVSKVEVGVYSAAYKLASMSLLIILTINIVFAPKISTLYNQKKTLQLKDEVRKTNRVMFILTLPIAVGLIVFNKFLLGLFGQEFLSGEVTLIILTIGFLFNSFSGTVAHILNMTDYQKILRNLTLSMAILNIGLNFILIPKFGITGAAVASLFSQIFLNLFAVYYVKKKLGFWAFL